RGPACHFFHADPVRAGSYKARNDMKRTPESGLNMKRRSIPRPKPCRYFLEGRCKKESECPFEHSSIKTVASSGDAWGEIVTPWDESPPCNGSQLHESWQIETSSDPWATSKRSPSPCGNVSTPWDNPVHENTDLFVRGDSQGGVQTQCDKD